MIDFSFFGVTKKAIVILLMAAAVHHSYYLITQMLKGFVREKERENANYFIVYVFSR